MGGIRTLYTYGVCVTISLLPILGSLLLAPTPAHALDSASCTTQQPVGDPTQYNLNTPTNVTIRVKNFSSVDQDRITKLDFYLDPAKFKFNSITGWTSYTSSTPTSGHYVITSNDPTANASTINYGGGFKDFTMNIEPVAQSSTYTNMSLSAFSESTNTTVTCAFPSAYQFRATTYTPPVTIPSAPVLSGTQGELQNTLNWTTISNATSYKLYQGSTLVYEGPMTTATHTGLTAGTAYIYKVFALNSAGQSTQSNDVTLTPTAPPPPPETDITVRDRKLIAMALASFVAYKAIMSFRWRGTEA